MLQVGTGMLRNWKRGGSVVAAAIGGTATVHFFFKLKNDAPLEKELIGWFVAFLFMGFLGSLFYDKMLKRNGEDP